MRPTHARGLLSFYNHYYLTLSQSEIQLRAIKSKIIMH